MFRLPQAMAIALSCTTLIACGGSSSGSLGDGAEVGGVLPPTAGTGNLTLALTDGPMSTVEQLVVHIESLGLRHSDGRVVRLEPINGPVDVDLAALRDGRLHDLLNSAEIPVGQYTGISIGIDPERSHADFSDGSRRRMQFAFSEGLNVERQFTIEAGRHAEFVIDVDLGQSLHRHEGGMGGGGMGGGMNDYYEFHSVTRMIDADVAGGLVGAIDSSLVDVNHPECDSAPGGNWAYLFPGSATEPDDTAQDEIDNRPGPIVTDRVDLHPGTGEYRYHFAFLEPGSYRVAFTCAGEWDEAGDDDYPADPDARFGFQAFSAPVEVIAGQVVSLDVGP